MDDRTLHILAQVLIAAALVGFAPQIFRWLRRIGFKGWPLPPDSDEAARKDTKTRH